MSNLGYGYKVKEKLEKNQAWAAVSQLIRHNRIFGHNENLCKTPKRNESLTRLEGEEPKLIARNLIPLEDGERQTKLV